MTNTISASTTDNLFAGNAPKKEMPRKDPAPKKEVVSANKAVGFLNWEIPLADGSVYKAKKGFPIFQNPKYPNQYEDMLIELAKSKGGIVELKMNVKVVLVQEPEKAPDLSLFITN